MGQVVALRPCERLLQDGEVIAALYRNLGASNAEQMISRAVAELALAMAHIAALVRDHQLQDVPKRLHKLRLMAENLGLTSLALVAADLRLCLETSDGTGFAAVWARLLRIAGRSLDPAMAPADFSR